MPAITKVISFLFILSTVSPSAFGDGSENSTPSSSYSDRPQWYITAGVTRLDADGRYGLYFPEFGNVPILDFGTVGLKDRDTSHYVSLLWRSRKSRWGTWIANWRFDATGSRVWNDKIPINQETSIPAGASVTSDFDAKFYIAELTYSIFSNEQVDAGVGFGFHTVDLETNLVASVNVGELEEELIRGEIDSLAPLPNVTGYTVWRFRPRWSLRGRLGWFGLSVDKFSGDMITAIARLDFHLTERWTLGAGYQFISFDVDVDEIEDEGYKEIYDLDFQGPMVLVSLTF